LRLTDFVKVERGILPEFGWLGATEVRRGRVRVATPPDRESVLQGGVHAFFREKEIEKGEELTDFPIEEQHGSYLTYRIRRKAP